MVAGSTAPYTFKKAYGNLPSGLALDSVTGTISGSPTGSGSYTFAIGVTCSAAGYVEMEYTIDLVPPLAITTMSLPRGTFGVPYNAAIAVTGGKPEYTFSLNIGAFCNDGWGTGWATCNLNLNANSGLISGTEFGVGTQSFIVTVSDSSGRKINRLFNITIDQQLSITTPKIADSISDVSYSQVLSSFGGYGAYTWSITSGSLPPGINLNSTTGVISGTTSSTGTYLLGITIQDATGRTDTAAYIFNISRPLTFATTALPSAYKGGSYNTSLQSSGGVAPFSYSVTGTLLSGLSLNTTGVIIGTPVVSGLSNLSFTITDSSYPTPHTVTKNLALRVWSTRPYTFLVSMAGNGSGTVTSDSGGVACTSGICSAELPSNTTVSLFATPNNRSLFGGWLGDCGDTAHCSFNLDANKSVSATFTRAPNAKIGVTGYDSLVAAYVGAASTATIFTLDSDMPDIGLSMGLGKTITIKGGYKADYSGKSGLPTLIKGALRIRNGKLTVDSLVVK